VVGAVAVVVLVCVLIARLYFLQVIQYDYHSTLSENNRLHVEPIVFRQGRVIVVLDDLQEIQPGNQHTHQHHHGHSPDH
ncbi:hypothetical protein QCD79_31375, partial [Pseudomonas quasicaspiana]|nr:hypothetical protein [Pseudomonas quasicaspiana]